MLKSYTNLEKEFHFVPENFHGGSDNIYTIIIGKNGSGKSRLLRSVIGRLLFNRKITSKSHFERDEELDFSTVGKCFLDVTTNVDKLICASTTPFDRFPILKKNKTTSFYSYLGLRGLPSNNIGLHYFDRTISSLIIQILEHPDQLQSIIDVLSYLGYEDGIECYFSPSKTHRYLSDVKKSKDPLADLRKFLNEGAIFEALMDEYESPFKTYIKGKSAIQRLDLLEKIANFPQNMKLHVNISSRGISTNVKEIETSALYEFAKAGLLFLRDIKFKKKETAKKFTINTISSGEQSIALSMLGIGSHIRDNSLICIDEPEICLHPEWQEKYIQTLAVTFKKYKNCHFIITTHSPQIISEAPKNNCFIMQIDDGFAVKSDNYSKKSSDYQLANLFKTPGFKNEYLLRELSSALAKIATTGKLSADQQITIKELLMLRASIATDDPIGKLMDLMKDALAEMTNVK